MAGRPKRTEEVHPLYLRLPPPLLERAQRCQALLQLHTGARMTQNDAFRRLLEAGCETLERTLEGRAPSAPAQMPIAEIAEISSGPISKIAEIPDDDWSLPGYGFPEDEELLTPQRNGAAQVAGTQQGAAPGPAAVKTAPTTRTQDTMRRRILTLLQAHPDGLDATYIRFKLHTRKLLGSTLSAMVQEHLLERQGSGQAARYRIATAPSVPMPQDAEAVTESQNGEIAIPPYDATKYVLGKLCPQGHTWGTTGQSLLSLPSHTCKECRNESKRRNRQKAKHQGQPA